MSSKQKGESSPFPKLLSRCSGEAQFWDRGIAAKVMRGDTEVGPQERDGLEAEVKGDRQSGSIVNPSIKL
ncbi:hypothetical protein [Laspinema palackyanum]|uniref:hypothetical protein n=1 Tax=Laspinema palackyanum TaxID=3231601 RepID=UPI00345DD2EE|nr:hypothetical protein [Laspinema sp. D2c]